MGMFNSYDNLKDNYIPSNMDNCPSCKKEQEVCQSCKPKMPYESYNELNELIGYWWYYGNTINLEFNMDGEITIQSSDIIFTEPFKFPNENTVGTVGQKAYNIVDFKSWTCTAIIDSTEVEPIKYVWTADEVFEPQTEGERNVYVDVSNFIKDKEIMVRIYDFRGAEIEEARKTFKGATTIVYTIDEELSKILKPSTYTCNLSVYTEGLNSTLLGQEECKLTVK